MPNLCPICNAQITILGESIENNFWCPNCGNIKFDLKFNEEAKKLLNTYRDKMVVSFYLFQMHKDNNSIELSNDLINQLLKNHLPPPSEQYKKIMLLIGDNTISVGDSIQIESRDLETKIGAFSRNSLDPLLKDLYTNGYLITVTPNHKGIFTLGLTYKGWEYYEELKKGISTSKKAFMAMQYGEKELDEIVEKYFKPAVKATGFDLFISTDEPKAGLIDDQIRNDIRTSRFLIADLTHDNNGAYWEAGFAEGLGKPVIYTCEKAKFEEKKTHFDTNHHLTVCWDLVNPEDGSRDLINTIRATLPDEAKMLDD